MRFRRWNKLQIEPSKGPSRDQTASGTTGAAGPPRGLSRKHQRKHRETPGNSMSDRIRLDCKVAVVTGAAGVIGAATTRLLAERGARIVAVDRREQDLKTAIADLP